MQAQLLEMKELLSVWYLVVLDNKIFVTALVIAVWVCFSLLYSIRSYFLKKQIKSFERKGNELKEQLNSAEKTIKSNEVTLATAEQQMEEEQQATVNVNEKISERHQQVVEKIREVARNFDLSEQLVGASDSISNETIWQQQDNMIAQLTEKLTAEKNGTSALEAAHKDEVSKISASNSSVEMVKEGLEVLTKQVENSALEQGNQQELLKSELQAQLIESLASNQAELVELISKLTLPEGVNQVTEELKPEPVIIDAVTPPPVELKVEEIAQEDIVVKEEIIEAKPEPVPAPAPLEMSAPAIEPVTKIDIPTVPTIERTLEKVVENIEPKPTVAPAPPAEVTDEIQVVPPLKAEKPKVVKKQEEGNKAKKILGFTRSLFSTKGMKKMPKQIIPSAEEAKQPEEISATAEPEGSDHIRDREEPVKLKNSDYDSGTKIDIKGKLRGLLGKKKK